VMSRLGLKSAAYATSDTAVRNASSGTKCSPLGDGREDVPHRVGHVAQRADLVKERLALLLVRQLAFEEQIPHVFERPLLGQLHRVVLR